MVEFARTGLDIGVTSGTRRYCPMGRLDILGNAYPFAEVAVPGGRRSSRLAPTTEFPTFRVDSSPYGRGIEPATTILKAVCFTRPAIALLLCGRICSYKKNMFARTSYVGVSASNATGKAARLEPGIGVGSRELCILLLR